MSFSIKSIPYIDQYIGPWEVYAPHAKSLLAIAKTLNIQLHLKEQTGAEIPDDDELLSVNDGVAVISIHGTLMKQRSSMTGSTSTVEARRAIRSASMNSDVSSIILHIDSPGGTSAGSGDLADEVAKAAARKPIIAFIEDLGASAAYKIASRATKIIANRADALVGSLGTYAVVYDMSEAYEKDGIIVHVVNVGEHKGAFIEGTEVTDDQLAELQRVVESANNDFVNAVSKGRAGKINDVLALFDGRIHSATEALRLGLIDGIQAYDEVVFSFTNSISAIQETTMSDIAPEKRIAATLKELRDTCPGCDSDFQLEMVELEATVQEAQQEWISRQGAVINKLQDENSQLLQQIDELKNRPSVGVDPIGTEIETNATVFGGAEDEFMQLVLEYSKKMPRSRAISYVASHYPEVYRAFREASNSLN